ncbi:MAG TPA: rhomboid family intramembrane serine protease [Abditibacteriaceae bacterium]|jgi:membrane associated rhomboid family serine protease
MFPLRAVHRPSRVPWLTRILVGACVLVWLWQVFAGGSSYGIERLGARPVCLLAPSVCGFDAVRHPLQWLWPMFASLFMHASLWHLALNLWFLWVFGPAVEDKMGRIKFPVFYLFCGLAASAAHYITQPFSAIPVVGASGAIAGILGAYLVWQPRGWILTYVPPFWVFPVPAPLFLMLWALSQVAGAFRIWSPNGASNIAWMAHLGGFAFGAWWAWRKTRRKKATAPPKVSSSPKFAPRSKPSTVDFDRTPKNKKAAP